MKMISSTRICRRYSTRGVPLFACLCMSCPRFLLDACRRQAVIFSLVCDKWGPTKHMNLEMVDSENMDGGKINHNVSVEGDWGGLEPTQINC